MKTKGVTLIVPILIIFSILSVIVYSVSSKISREMSQSAITNLGESLDLIKGTMQAILKNEAEFQTLLAQEAALSQDPEQFIQSFSTNKTMVKMSVIMSGKTTGVSNNGEEFSPQSLDFSAGSTVNGLPVSTSYLNSLGTWAYTIKCPVIKEEKEIASLYIEYIYDSFEEALPRSFYNHQATLYVMDAKSTRFVLKPKGLMERVAGQLNLDDFYRANAIMEEDIHTKVASSIAARTDMMFYHDILKKESLIYMWEVNDGTLYLVGYVPIDAIQQEGTTVNQNILIVVFVMLAAFLICYALYFLNNRQQERIRREREMEREIHSQQLAEALEAARIASRSKTMFLSNMSHDIRTPMNAILGFTILLTKDAEDPVKVREYTKKITASGKHLLSLINDVLDVSKIESGKVALNLGEFTLNSVISSVDAIIRPMAKDKHQQFNIAVKNISEERLIGDETRINQILINLLSNAVKYTPEGGNIWFRIIGMEQRSDQYAHIRIEVEDDGYGMTQEYLSTIFDAFTRAENSTTNKVQGTGLGMAITKNIVELMGGTIQVASEIDKGSIFTVELELRIPEVKSDKEFWQESGISRILVVDDDEDICRNVQILMKDTGVQTDAVLSGKEALECVYRISGQDSHYDVILLDCRMPGMDGLETAKYLRSVVPKDTLILFLTAYDWEDIKYEAVQAGVDGFLAKPFFVSALIEKILEIQTRWIPYEQPPEIPDKSLLKGLHFLVAEDNEINAEILQELLEIEEASCQIEENGQLALEAFQNCPPGTFDAILMDVQMPVMNGHEATKAIRKLGREDARTIPIIAMTANAFAEDVKDAKEAGMDDHIAKPIDMEIVKKTLYKYLTIKVPDSGRINK